MPILQEVHQGATSILKPLTDDAPHGPGQSVIKRATGMSRPTGTWWWSCFLQLLECLSFRWFHVLTDHIRVRNPGVCSTWCPGPLGSTPTGLSYQTWQLSCKSWTWTTKSPYNRATSTNKSNFIDDYGFRKGSSFTLLQINLFVSILSDLEHVPLVGWLASVACCRPFCGLCHMDPALNGCLRVYKKTEQKGNIVCTVKNITHILVQTFKLLLIMIQFYFYSSMINLQ